MAINEASTTVHPIAGFDFQMVPGGVLMRVRYYTDVEAAPDKEAPRPSHTMESVTVGLTASQAKDVANSLQRAAQLIESSSSQNNALKSEGQAS